MIRLAGVCVMCAALCACAGGGGGAHQEATDSEAHGIRGEIAPGPMVPAEVEWESASDPEAFEQPDPVAGVKRESDDLLMRRDGRPSWWFGKTMTGEGRVMVCAEALGGDMLGAKRSAIEAARQRLREEMGLGPGSVLDDEQVERAWVWPLPHAETPGSRYAGYVLVSVAGE